MFLEIFYWLLDLTMCHLFAYFLTQLIPPFDYYVPNPSIVIM